MFELLVLLVGAAPFLIGFYAVQIIRKNDDEGSDDQPPPPDPEPPLPVLPPDPEAKRSPTTPPRSDDRGPIRHDPSPSPSWRTPVR